MMSCDWRARAACLHLPPELFFPVATKGPAFEEQVRRAKAACERCAVSRECLHWALTGPVQYGIYGGFTEAERYALRGQVD